MPVCVYFALRSYQKLYFARVSHGMVQFVLEMAHLSILMKPTLLLEKASATVSYNAFG